MRILNILWLSLLILLILGCSKVKLPVTDEYQLSAYSCKNYASKPRPITVQVTAPEAITYYQTQEMLYVNKPYQIESFAKNAWKAPPASMLSPLIVQSLQRSGYFYAVTSSPYVEEADYRLDTQLLKLDQNFLSKPSVVEFSAKVVLTRIDNNKVLGSRIFSYSIPCTIDSPYGGVLAANQATEQFTAAVSGFVISHLKGDKA